MIDDPRQKLERQPWLHIHGQDMWHDSVIIRGNGPALEALRGTITRALTLGTRAGTTTAYVADGEGYEILVELMSYDDMTRDPLPYTAEFANPQRNEKAGIMNTQDEPMLQFFAYAHLPPHLQVISKPFGELAEHMVKTLPKNPERTAGLRKLLEAKDCAVRAQLYK